MPELLGVPIAGLTAPALAGFAVLAVLRGWLVPRKTYDDLKEDRDRWQQAHSISEEARLTQTRQLDAVLEVGQTVKNVMEALDHVRREGRQQ